MNKLMYKLLSGTSRHQSSNKSNPTLVEFWSENLNMLIFCQDFDVGSFVSAVSFLQTAARSYFIIFRHEIYYPFMPLSLSLPLLKKPLVFISPQCPSVTITSLCVLIVLSPSRLPLKCVSGWLFRHRSIQFEVLYKNNFEVPLIIAN